MSNEKTNSVHRITAEVDRSDSALKVLEEVIADLHAPPYSTRQSELPDHSRPVKNYLGGSIFEVLEDLCGLDAEGIPDPIIDIQIDIQKRLG